MPVNRPLNFRPIIARPSIAAAAASWSNMTARTEFALDFDSWIAYRFAYADEPGTQIDALWWDMGRLGNVFYPSKLLNQLKNPALEKWRRQGIDLVGRLVEETRKRKLEVFWHHRVSEVDSRCGRSGTLPQSGPIP